MTMIRAKKCNLMHSGIECSNLAADGKRRKKQQLKGTVKETVDQVLFVKEDSPKPKDVIKAAANLSGEAVTYNQGYRGIKNINDIIIKNDEESFQYIILYLSHFQECIWQQ
jgi:hypothetical protein